MAKFLQTLESYIQDHDAALQLLVTIAALDARNIHCSDHSFPLRTTQATQSAYNVGIRDARKCNDIFMCTVVFKIQYILSGFHTGF